MRIIIVAIIMIIVAGFTSFLRLTLLRPGIKLSPSTLEQFMISMSTKPHSRHVNFGEFRDFFILLPRKISPAEIYQYYEMRRYLGDDGRGPARVNMEGKHGQNCHYSTLNHAVPR